MEKEFDYKKLAIVIIREFESDRMESGEKEVEKGMRYILKNQKKFLIAKLMSGDETRVSLEEWRKYNEA